MELEKLCIQIEEVREILNKLCEKMEAENNKDRILNISMKLDKLIVEYINSKNNYS